MLLDSTLYNLIEDIIKVLHVLCNSKQNNYGAHKLALTCFILLSIACVIKKLFDHDLL